MYLQCKIGVGVGIVLRDGLCMSSVVQVLSHWNVKTYFKILDFYCVVLIYVFRNSKLYRYV